MKFYTIGFTQKSAETFFGLLEKAQVTLLLDTRLNNVSQLAGFTKARDLKYFLKRILNAKYLHSIECAPTKDILDNYKKGKISWVEYEKKYNALLEERNIKELFPKKVDIEKETVCILCSEDTPENCHRRLLAEYLKKHLNAKIEIVHLL